MNRLTIKIGTEVLITWAVVFGATFHAGMTGDAFALMIAAILVQGGRDVLKELANPNPNPFPGIPLKPVAAVVALLLAMCFITGCAHTNFNATDSAGHSHRVAHFEGDMVGQSFTYNDGKTAINWTCTSVSHSAATQAQGQAADTVLGGVSTATSS